MFDSFLARVGVSVVGGGIPAKAKPEHWRKTHQHQAGVNRLYRESRRSTVRPVGLPPLAMVPARHLDAVVFLRNAPAEVGMHHVQTMIYCLGKPVKFLTAVVLVNDKCIITQCHNKVNKFCINSAKSA